MGEVLTPYFDGMEGKIVFQVVPPEVLKWFLAQRDRNVHRLSVP